MERRPHILRPGVASCFRLLFRCLGRGTAQRPNSAERGRDFPFALGALSHYASDITGHPFVNRAVAENFPKLKTKYGPNRSALCYLLLRSRTICTEHRAWRATASETLPSKNRSSPFLPWEPTTIRSGEHWSAYSRIDVLASPSRTIVFVVKPAACSAFAARETSASPWERHS